MSSFKHSQQSKILADLQAVTTKLQASGFNQQTIQKALHELSYVQSDLRNFADQYGRTDAFVSRTKALSQKLSDTLSSKIDKSIYI